MDKFDEAFQFLIEVFGFSDSHKFASKWTEQIFQIDFYWDQLLDSFNREDFRRMFCKYCNIDRTPTYNFDDAFKKAKTEWRIDLMTRVADEIAHSHILGIPHSITLVKWVQPAMLIDLEAIKTDVSSFKS